MLFFGLELPDTIVYKHSEAFVDFNLLFYLFMLARDQLSVGVSGGRLYFRCASTLKRII